MAAAIKDTVNSMLSALNLGGEKTAEDVPPQPPTESEFNELKQSYEKAGQGQVLQYWEELKPAEQGALYKQLQPIDPEHINKITEKALNPPEEKSEDSEDSKPKLDQLPNSATSSVIDSKEEDLNKWYDAGLKLISENQVGVVLMAGGQGTRLGSSAPKGCFDIGLPSKKSLFQLQAERIGKLQRAMVHHDFGPDPQAH
jgi:UDP-N-acetylglucosamine/UDP-N-acetylgalactosamine diphosphorylase